MHVFKLVKSPMGPCFISISAAALLATVAVAPASSSYRSRVPNGSVFSCRTCHNGSEGNGGNVGDFGNDFADNGFRWSASLANKDSDGDGAKNGVELLDPNGTWVKGQANPGSSNNVRNPNSSSSVPPKATPTPSPSPSPSSTPTPSPSPSPTAIPTPVATYVQFPFVASAEGWTFASPADFAVSTGGHDAASQSLRISTTNNTNAFALQQSPAFLIAPTSPGGIVVIDGSIGANSLYRATYHAKSNLANGAIVPAIRLRSNSANFEQGDVMVISSSGNGDLSPATTTKTYRQYFSQPASSNGFLLSFDVLNFDPGDSAASSLFVEDVTAEAMTVLDPSIGTAFSNFDFVADGASGFTFHSVVPTMGEPAVHTDAAGLNLAGTAPVTAKYQIPAGTLFGYWEGQSTSTIAAGSLYGVSFTVASTATADTKVNTPTFRLRVNDSSLKLSAYVNIDARGTDSRIPVAGTPEVYTVWFEAPGSIDGSTLLYSFDYLYMGGSDEDPAIQLTLQGLSATSYPAP